MVLRTVNVFEFCFSPRGGGDFWKINFAPWPPRPRNGLNGSRNHISPPPSPIHTHPHPFHPHPVPPTPVYPVCHRHHLPSPVRHHRYAIAIASQQTGTPASQPDRPLYPAHSHTGTPARPRRGECSFVKKVGFEGGVEPDPSVLRWLVMWTHF